MRGLEVKMQFRANEGLERTLQSEAKIENVCVKNLKV